MVSVVETVLKMVVVEEEVLKSEAKMLDMKLPPQKNFFSGF